MNEVVVNKVSRADLLGFFTHPGTADDYLALVTRVINERSQSFGDGLDERQVIGSAKRLVDGESSATIFYHNLHTLYVYVTSDEYRKTYANTTVIVDGMGVLFLYKLAGFPLSRDYRLTYVDFMMPMMKLARDNGWRVFHIGQDASVQKNALQKIRNKFPGIQIAGQDGFFDQTNSSAGTREVVQQVNDYSADLLLVGLGTPRQELWVHANRDQLNATVVMTCGSIMEYIDGKVKTAPRWMGYAGLEWAFRLFEDPKRFAFRYLVQPFLLAGILFRNWLQRRRKQHHS